MDLRHQDGADRNPHAAPLATTASCPPPTRAPMPALYTASQQEQSSQHADQPLPPPALPGVTSSNFTLPSPSPSGSDSSKPKNDTNKRRRTTTQSSRGVANLTPEQLAKKRANDREAQRAIRERTKLQIESLEKKIEELSNQKTYQDVQEIQRQKEAVQAENEDIKRKLLSIQRILQPLTARGGSPDCSTAGPATPGPSLPPVFGYNESRLTSTPQIPAFSASMSYDNASIKSSHSASSGHTMPSQAQQTTAPVSPAAFYSSPGFTGRTSNGTSAPTAGARMPDERLAMDFLTQPRPNGLDAAGNQIPTERDLPKPVSAANLLLSLDWMRYSSTIETLSSFMPVSAMLTRNVSPTCPLDNLLLDFLDDQRKRAYSGVPIQELIGPAYPSFYCLTHPNTDFPSHPLSKVITELLLRFPDISKVPEQVAVLYIMFLVMRWQLSPTSENYARLPEWMTPRASQIFTAHPAWIDHLPFPRMRDKMVEIYPTLPFEEFFIPYTTTCSLNWPHDPRDVLCAIPGSQELALTPKFEEHLRDLGNWTLGPAFTRAHPRLQGTVKVKP